MALIPDEFHPVQIVFPPEVGFQLVKYPGDHTFWPGFRITNYEYGRIWGFFDFRLPDEDLDYNLGYQSVPVNWQITWERKRDFFNLLAEITGSPGAPSVNLDRSDVIGEGVVRIENQRTDLTIEQIEVIINNTAIATAQNAPFEFQLDEMPDGEHWVKVRVTYLNNNGEEIIVESPYHRNPWWPYGGRY